MGWMADEISSQPGLIEANAARYEEQAAGIRDRAASKPTLVLLGRGSSGNACAFANYLYATQTGRQAVILRPWATTEGVPEADWSDAWVLAYSVSGQSPDVARAAAWMKSRGARVVGVTNADSADCRLGEAADELFFLNAQPERAVASTKTYGVQLVASAALMGLPVNKVAGDIAASMRDILRSDAPRKLAGFLDDAELAWWVSRGYARAAALDAGLKFMESAGVPSTAWSAAEVLHGPVGSANPRHRAVFFFDAEGAMNSMDKACNDFRTRGVPVLRVGDVDGEDSLRVSLPAERWARTPVLAFLSQQASLELALQRGRDPDAPAGLQKVTVT